jgi:hypothetical protein
MKLLLQRIKIGIVSTLFLLILGALLHFLAYYSTGDESVLIIIGLVVLIMSHLITFHQWLNRLYRELIIIKYKKGKKKYEDVGK